MIERTNEQLNNKYKIAPIKRYKLSAAITS
jgi:hypothetical protein